MVEIFLCFDHNLLFMKKVHKERESVIQVLVNFVHTREHLNYKKESSDRNTAGLLHSCSITRDVQIWINHQGYQIQYGLKEMLQFRKGCSCAGVSV